MNIECANIECSCGEEVGVTGEVETVECPCGATYAVTVTQILPGRKQ